MSANVSAVREPLFSERETAQLLGISASYLRVLRGQKRIAYYRFGGRVLYAENHIFDFKRASEQFASVATAA